MTVPLPLYDTSQFPAATSAFLVIRQRRLKAVPGCRVKDMAPPTNSGSSAAVAVRGVASMGIWRLLAVAAPHAGAVALMLETAPDLDGRLGFVLAWGIINFFWIALLCR